jgi:hypothetical protein
MRLVGLSYLVGDRELALCERTRKEEALSRLPTLRWSLSYLAVRCVIAVSRGRLCYTVEGGWYILHLVVRKQFGGHWFNALRRIGRFLPARVSHFDPPGK